MTTRYLTRRAESTTAPNSPRMGVEFQTEGPVDHAQSSPAGTSRAAKSPARFLLLATLTLTCFALAGPAAAETASKDSVLVTFNGKIAPTELPRVGLAPVRMSVSGDIRSTDSSQPPALETVDIEINRHGHVFYKGLPTCPAGQLTNTTSSVALHRCRSALIGSGHFRAKVIFPQASPFPAIGKILSFNSVTPSGQHVILAHIFGRVPLATTYILPFTITRTAQGTYGTTLTGTFPQVADNWGYVTHFDLTLKRKFLYKGREHGFLNAGCPIPKGIDRAPSRSPGLPRLPRRSSDLTHADPQLQGAVVMDARRSPAKADRIGSASSVDVGAVGYRQNFDDPLFFIEGIDHSVGPATRYPAAFQLEAQRLAETSGVGGDRGQQLDDCHRVALRDAFQATAGGPGYDEPPGLLLHAAELAPRRRLKSACSSSSVAVSPASIAASPSRICAISLGSERTARVSSRLSRSSGLISTAAGRPLRVTTTRSCSPSTRSAISERWALTYESGRVSDMTNILVTWTTSTQPRRAREAPTKGELK